MRKLVAGAPLRWLWLFLALSAAAIYPALTNNIGALAYDAGTVHLYRSFVFSGAISDGVLYPRWVQFLHLGLGSPLFTFNPPLPYYALDLLYRLGIGHPLGWRILIAAGLLAAATGAYALVYLMTRQRWPAVLAAVAYLYAPYVLRNALERGSLETFSMFLYPWVLWALLWLAQRPSAGRFVVATVLWAACIACHVLGPLMLAPVALLLVVVAGWRYRTVAPVLALLAGGLLTAAIWLPIVPEQSFVRLDLNFEGNYLATPLKHPLPLDRLLALPALYDVNGGNNGSGDVVGLGHVALLLIGVPATLYAWWSGRRQTAIYLGLATLTGLLLFWMLTGTSDPVWRLFEPVLTRLEFRSRWLGLLSLAAAVAGGLALALLPGRMQRYAGIGLAMLLVVLALPNLYVGLQHRYATFGNQLSWAEVRAAEINSGGSAFTSWNEFAPRWRRAPFGPELLRQLGGAGFDPTAQPLANPPSGLSVRDARVSSSAWELGLEASRPATATLNLLYYPRWQATLDGGLAALQPEPVTGLTQLSIPTGSHRLSLRYGPTTAELAGLAISGLAALGLAALLVWGWYRANRSGDHKDRPVQANTRFSPTRNSEDGRAPSFWLLGGLTVLLGIKALYVDPSTTWLRCVSSDQQMCGMQQTVNVDFPSAPSLRGYNLVTPEIRPGGEVVVNLAWQTSRPVATRLRSFVHIRNSEKGQAVNPETGSEIWIQEDHETPGGLFASEYEPGKVYVDEMRVSVPANMPPGNYFLEVGWTDPASGEQLDVVTDSVKEPLRVLWRSVLLPGVRLR